MFQSLSLVSCVVIDKSLHHLEGSVSSFLNGDNAFLTVDKSRGSPSNSTPMHILERHESIRPHRKYVYTYIHSSFIYNGAKVETTQMLIN